MSSYLDTSFLLSLYITDGNSGPAAARMQRLSPPAIISSLTELESVTSLQLRVFRKQLTAAEADEVYEAMRRDQRAGVFSVGSLSEAVYALAIRLSSRWTAKFGARSLDVIHVAAALELGADHFETFDRRFAALAEAVGFKVT